MTTEPKILTNEQRESFKAQFVANGTHPHLTMAELSISLQTEQAVLQSPEVRAWKKDAERLDWLQDEMGTNLVNDDDGRWAISDSGMQPVPPKGGFTETTSNVCIVDPEAWKPSIRAAIDAAMEKQK